MQDDRPISVLILYAHALLGEGLADLLGSEPRLDVTAVAIRRPRECRARPGGVARR